MAISSVVKNFRDGTIKLADGTGTPIEITVQYENGDFSLSGTNQGNYEHTKYLDRGELGSITAQLTDLSDATNKTLWDAVNKTGAFASAVSTLGSTADLYALDITFTISGTVLGDASDHVLTLNDCRCSIDLAEGDPDSFTLNFEVLGSITAS